MIVGPPQAPKREGPLQLTTPAARAFLKSLIYGSGGYGKTTLLGTANEDERTRPMILLDFEGNTESLQGLDIDIVTMRDWDDFSEAYERLLLDGSFVSQFTGEKFKSLGLDSLTEVNMYALREEVLRKAPRRESKGEDPNYPQIQDYGVVLNQMQRLVRNFRELPMHVFMTAIDDDAVISGEGNVKLPMMVGQMRHQISALMSCHCCLVLTGSTEDPHRTLLLHDIPKVRAKIRTPWKMNGSAPRELDDPTVTKLLDILLPKAGKPDKR